MSDFQSGIQEIARCIATTSQKIVNEMKKDTNQMDFKDFIREIKNRSEAERKKYKDDFNKKTERIRKKFNGG